jgi:cytochrome c oxidase subunit 2
MFFALRGERFSKVCSTNRRRARSFVTPAASIIMKRNIIFCLLSFLFLLWGCQKKNPTDASIHVSMKKYTIEPAVIRVKSGQKVVLEVTTADVQHGLDIPELGINEPVQPGKTTTISFIAPAKGEYRVACGVVCGPRHDDMVGKLVVE